ETAWYGPETHKAQFLIKSQSICIAADHCIKLENTESQFSPFIHAVLYQNLSYMLPPHIRPHCIAGITDMPAAPDIIGMKDIETYNVSRVLITGDSRKRLFLKKCMSAFLCQRLCLWKSHS